MLRTKRIAQLLALVLLLTACRRSLPPLPGDDSPSASAPAAGERPAPPRPPVGVTNRYYEDARRDRKLNTTIWYPAAPGVAEDTIWWDGIFPGRGAWDGPIKTTRHPLPLVLLSHGSGGDGPNLAWLAEGLAAHGWVAAAVDHPGDRFGDSSGEGRLAAWRRAPDVSFVLSRLLEDGVFGRRIDRRRIAAAGHSSGGFAVLQLAGARFRPEDFIRHCDAPDPGPDCELISGVDLTDIRDRWDASRSYRDRRVRAVVALAPVYGPGVPAKSLRAITTPVEIVASRSDELVPFGKNAARYAQLIPRARLTVVPGAGHFVFMPVCSDAGAFIASQVCVDPSASVDRAAVHADALARTREFFARALALR